MNFQDSVREWNEKFGVAVATRPAVQPEEIGCLRANLIREECEELCEALERGDLIGIADGIADLHYVVSGTAVSYGIDENAVFAEVHRSNMSKLWPDGKPRYREDGKVLKPDTYSPANIAPLLETGK